MTVTTIPTAAGGFWFNGVNYAGGARINPGAAIESALVAAGLAIPYPPQLPPNPSKIALALAQGRLTTIPFGDSITANGAQTQPTFTVHDDRGFFEWANVMSGHNWTILRNAGIAGNTTAQMLARVQSDVIAYGPTACEVMGGTNDLGFLSGDQIIANLFQIYKSLYDAGIYVRAYTILPRPGLSAALQATILYINVWIREVCNNNPGFECMDAFAYAVSPSSTTQAFITNGSSDGTHPLNACAFAIGQGLAPQLAKWPILSSRYPSSASDDLSVNTAVPNVSANPLMLGTAGTLTGTATGTVPNNWNVNSNLGTCTASISSRSDGFGNDLVMTCASTGNQFARATSNFQSFGVTGGLQVGDSYFCVGEVTVSNPVNLGQLIFQCTTNGQVSGGPTNLSTVYPLPQAAVNQKFTFVTPVATITSGSTYLLQLNAVFTATGGSAVIKLGRAAMYRYPSNPVHF